MHKLCNIKSWVFGRFLISHALFTNWRNILTRNYNVKLEIINLFIHQHHFYVLQIKCIFLTCGKGVPHSILQSRSTCCCWYCFSAFITWMNTARSWVNQKHSFAYYLFSVFSSSAWMVTFSSVLKYILITPLESTNCMPFCSHLVIR